MADTVHCSRCGADVPAGNQCPACRRFLPGNVAARTHGAWSFERGRGEAGLPAPMVQSIDEWRASVVRDRGGEGEMTTIELALVRRLSELEIVARLLAADLASKGLFTPRGRVRGVYRVWLETLDRFDKYCARVGGERREKPFDPIKAVHRAVREANRR